MAVALMDVLVVTLVAMAWLELFRDEP